MQLEEWLEHQRTLLYPPIHLMKELCMNMEDLTKIRKVDEIINFLEESAKQEKMVVIPAETFRLICGG